MSVADLHDLELTWPSLHPTAVVVTGTFDQWSSSIHLAKGDTGFFGTVKVPWGQKVAYKFIVDGHWQCRNDRPQEDDGNGNINNVLCTPEKPPVASQVVIHDPPSRLSIPPKGAQNGDVETMVTAIEYFLPAESAEVRGSLPFTIPQIVVEGLGPAPSADTSVSVSKLDTANATEGTVPPASRVPEELVPSSSDVSTLPVSVNSSVPEIVREVVSAPLESTTPQSNRSPRDVPALIDRADIPPALKPAAVLKSTPKQPEVDHQTVVQSQRQKITVPASISESSSPSIPPSSTLTHKKRRSLFARIKLVFAKHKDRGERK